ncbi:MAG: hypothetical protein KGH54_01495 [Candidatus Micrarchaeota archaeon]|nr:hypothetical protein [Candidatus Micrarchaeota archaeon]
MPIVFERRNGDGPKSSLRALAKNVLREEFRERDGMERFTPRDERYYDALASVVVYHSIMDANISQLQFYVSNGYNTDIRIKSGGQTQTLVEFAISAMRRSKDAPFAGGMREIAEYLQGRLHLSSGIPPIFRIIEYPRSKNFKVHTNYQIGEYNCTIRLNGRSLTVWERGYRKASAPEG